MPGQKQRPKLKYELLKVCSQMQCSAWKQLCSITDTVIAIPPNGVLSQVTLGETKGEIFNKAVQSYVKDPQKNIPNLMEYAKVLRVQKKVKDLIGVWL